MASLVQRRSMSRKPEIAATAEPLSLAITSALRTLEAESSGLTALMVALRNGLGEAFEALRKVQGRVIVSGIGKSGHIGRKIAATFASTGTPAFFIHPSEAAHGDLGMITPQDVLLAISWSGETIELKNLVNYSRRFGVPLISITSRATSGLGQASDVVIELPRASEACPHGLAPTTSTTMQLVIGDCLAVALLEARGFSATDFKVFHPGGSLGAQLKFVADLMHKDDRLPLARVDEPMTEALVTMTQKALGCLGVVDGNGQLVGIITDGDLRRHMGPTLWISLTSRGSRRCSWSSAASRSGLFTCTTCCAPASPEFGFPFGCRPTKDPFQSPDRYRARMGGCRQ
jgi:arabinose-5-phosphate isomerase